MTAFDRFDPFERRISDAIDEIATARPLDYLDDILRQTARTAQRPRWTFPERWLNVDTTIPRPTVFGRVPIRNLIVLALLLALAAAAVGLYVGSQRKLPPAFGPAANGQLAYVSNGDIYVRDTFTGEGHLLVGGAGLQYSPTFSPDGTRIAYATDAAGSDPFFVANADGSNPVQIALIPPVGWAQAYWAPDSSRMALFLEVQGLHTLTVATVDGTSQAIDLGGLEPWDGIWLPPTGDRLLIRAEDSSGSMDFYSLRPDGSGLTPFGRPQITDFGPQYTLASMSVSPDGTTMVYNGVDSVHEPPNLPFQHFRLHLVATDGSNDRAIPGPENPRVHENWPSFSPDGKWIVAQRWTFEDTAGGLVIMPADGSQPGREIGPQTVGGDLVKVWSPDSSRILMVVNETHPAQVFSIDPISGDYDQVSWAEDIPDWQRAALP